MGKLVEKYYLGLDKQLRKVNELVFRDITNLENPIYKFFGKKLSAFPHWNRLQWTLFLEERSEEHLVTFFFVGHARSMEMLYFLNSKGGRKNIAVIFLLAEKTPDKTIINKFNNDVRVLDYWKYVQGDLSYDKLIDQLRRATA